MKIARKVVILVSVLLAIVGTVAFATDTVYYYQCEMKNGTNINDGVLKTVYRPNSISTIKNIHSIKFDFSNGTLELNSPYSEFCENGQSANINIQPGSTFVFDCLFNTTDGNIKVAVDGEIIATADNSYIKGKTNIYNYMGWYDTTPCSNGLASALEIKNTVKSKAEETQLSIESGTTTGVMLLSTSPIQHEQIKNFSITVNNTSVPIVDYSKEYNSNLKKWMISLSFGNKVPNGSTVIVNSESVHDIFGMRYENTDISYVALSEGTLSVGKTIELNAKEKVSLEFEKRMEWFTDSNLLGNNRFLDSNGLFTANTLLVGQSYYNNLHAMKLSKNFNTSGKYSIKWENHNCYSRIVTNTVPHDWSGSNKISFELFNDLTKTPNGNTPTNELIYLFVESDNKSTPWKDGYFYPIKLDWKGYKKFEVPLSEFYSFENPTGFDNVSSIGFSSKLFDKKPNPYTILYIDTISITYDSNYAITPHVKTWVEKENAHRDERFDDSSLNHSFPEITSNLSTPFEYDAYYKAERSLMGYFPKYVPGTVSFSPSGKAYILSNGTHIQYKNDIGQWEEIDLAPLVRKYIYYENSTKYKTDTRIWENSAFNEMTLRFDNKGYIYALISTGYDVYLCYSNDLSNWKVECLGKDESGNRKRGRFEKVYGNNQAALDNPPLIVISCDTSDSIQGAVLIIPEWDSNGNLNLTHRIEYSNSCVVPIYHTGDGNSFVSDGEMVYLVYSVMEGGAEHGVSTYIISYNKKTRTLSEPQFLGYAGSNQDNHNWPGIDIDSNGYLHVILNGHHDPIKYIMSKKPHCITEWNEPEEIGNILSYDTMNYYSYGAIMIDKQDNIFIIARDSSRGYRFDTSLIKKAANSSSWTKINIVKRKAPYYEVARQRMTYNYAADQIFVFYYAQSAYSEYFKDEYDALLFTWPNLEHRLVYNYNSGYNRVPIGTDKTSTKTKYTYTNADIPGREGVVVYSTDHGESFKLAQTENFK